MLPGKIMLVDGPLSGQVTDRPDTGNAYVYYPRPGRMLSETALPARFMVASYLVLRCERGGHEFWIGSTGVRPEPNLLAKVLSLPGAEQCRTRRGAATIGRMAVQVNINEDETYPYYFATFADDPRDVDEKFYPTDELSDEEAADLRRVRDEHAEWQRKLGEMREAKWEARHGQRRR